MALPAAEKIEEIIAPAFNELGLDVENVKVVRAGAKSQLIIAVDGEERPSLDFLESATTIISDALDDAEGNGAVSFGAQPYTLEVSTPGVDAPLTKPRHWRRNRGRKAIIRLQNGDQIVGRIGALNEQSTAVVVITTAGPKGRLTAIAQSIRLGEVDTAVVEVEFAPAPTVEKEIVGLDYNDALTEAGGNNK